MSRIGQGRLPKRDADGRGGQRAQDHLALAADVERAGPEREAHPEARDHDRHAASDRCGEVARRPDRAAEQLDVGRPRVRAGEDHDESADRERERDRDDRDEDRDEDATRVPARGPIEGWSRRSSMCPVAGRRGRNRRHAGIGRARRRVGRLVDAARPDAGHEQADVHLGRLGPRELADDSAPVQHHDPIGERQDLGQVGADQQHPRAFVASPQDLAANELGGRDVDPAGRLRGDDERPRLGRTRARSRRVAHSRPRASAPAETDRMCGCRTASTRSRARRLTAVMSSRPPFDAGGRSCEPSSRLSAMLASAASPR